MRPAETVLGAIDGELRGDLAATIQCWLELLGGPEGLAKEMKKDFDANEDGNSNRIKIELATISMMQDLGGPSDDDVDEEQLAALEKQMDAT